MTNEEIEARMEGFEEAASHLEGNVTDDKIERKEFTEAAKMIRKLAADWYETQMGL